MARRGQVIQIYAIIWSIRDPNQVYIGGIEARVDFSGMAPDLAGVWQINAAIPDRPFVSGRLPVIVFMDGVDSNEVTIFVAQ